MQILALVLSPSPPSSSSSSVKRDRERGLAGFAETTLRTLALTARHSNFYSSTSHIQRTCSGENQIAIGCQYDQVSRESAWDKRMERERGEMSRGAMHVCKGLIALGLSFGQWPPYRAERNDVLAKSKTPPPALPNQLIKAYQMKRKRIRSAREAKGDRNARSILAEGRRRTSPCALARTFLCILHRGRHTTTVAAPHPSAHPAPALILLFPREEGLQRRGNRLTEPSFLLLSASRPSSASHLSSWARTSSSSTAWRPARPTRTPLCSAPEAPSAAGHALSPGGLRLSSSCARCALRCVWPTAHPARCRLLVSHTQGPHGGQRLPAGRPEAVARSRRAVHLRRVLPGLRVRRKGGRGGRWGQGEGGMAEKIAQADLGRMRQASGRERERERGARLRLRADH